MSELAEIYRNNNPSNQTIYYTQNINGYRTENIRRPADHLAAGSPAQTHMDNLPYKVRP